MDPQARLTNSHDPRCMYAVGASSSSAAKEILAVTAAPAVHPDSMSALAKMPDRAKLAAEPRASTNPKTEVDFAVLITSA